MTICGTILLAQTWMGWLGGGGRGGWGGGGSGKEILLVSKICAKFFVKFVFSRTKKFHIFVTFSHFAKI